MIVIDNIDSIAIIDCSSATNGNADKLNKMSELDARYLSSFNGECYNICILLY